jgi:signal peptidase I
MPEPPALHRKRYHGDEVPLSSAALLDLLSAVHEKGADFRFRAPGLSMYPTIRDGDIITVSPLKGGVLTSSDIVAFRHPGTGKLVVHRIIGVSSDSFKIMGDNSSEPDGYVPLSLILGVVTSVERDGRPLFWPDSRRFPLGARIYFKMGYGVMILKKRGYAQFANLIRVITGRVQ